MKKSKLMVRRQTIRILSDNSLVRPQGGGTTGCEPDTNIHCTTLGTNQHTMQATCRHDDDTCKCAG